MHKSRIEHYRQGYPRVAAFLGADRGFLVFRRFENLHLRSLLDQQDILYELETRLNECDDTETVQLHLSSRRQDKNQQRKSLLQEIKQALSSYDRSVCEYRQMLAIPEAEPNQRRNVKNWVHGTKPLVKSESACFIENLEDKEFITLKPDGADNGILESLLELGIRKFPKVSNLLCSSRLKTDDPNIFLYSPILLERILKSLLVPLVSLWLILPAILLYNASRPRNRTIIYAIFTFGASCAILTISGITKYNTIIAIVTYGAVLAAFLSGTANSST
ncbi:hypothetical protein BDZ45DRAFT_290779 [Acephala macrosclerotiorum]|nr:hypothetical protein BDZ45DRAFT_290779 [Acephala macrosclerotiorum]